MAESVISGDQKKMMVGTVMVVEWTDKSTNNQSSILYHYKETTPAAINTSQRFFLAILAPNSALALQWLAHQPPGAYVLAVDESDDLSIFIKFRRAVRVTTLIGGKELKKYNENGIEWNWEQPPPPPEFTNARNFSQPNVTWHTSGVHRVRLAPYTYSHLETCWTRFLPAVQALVMDLCSEVALDEKATIENWEAAVAASSASDRCIFTLHSTACAFFILIRVRNNDGSTSNLTAIPVRQIEFDVQKMAIVVSDGTHKPSAFLNFMHFTSKRVFDAGIRFAILRDNFLWPDQVMLKETNVSSTMPIHQSLSCQNFVDVNCTDPELMLLTALQTACKAIIPYKPLPVGFLDALMALHSYFVRIDAAERVEDDQLLHHQPLIWPKEKLDLVMQFMPCLLELMVATALSPFRPDTSAVGPPSCTNHDEKKSQEDPLIDFARTVCFDLVFLAQRSDAAMCCRLVHQLLQLFALRLDLPGICVELIRELIACVPMFQAQFLKHQGFNALWTALCSGDHSQQLSANMTGRVKEEEQKKLSAPASTQLQTRRSSLFTMGRKPTAFAIPPNAVTYPSLTFFRVDPVCVQDELKAQLCQRHAFDRPKEVGCTQQSNHHKDAMTSAEIWCFCQEVNANEDEFHLDSASDYGAGCLRQPLHGCRRKQRQASAKITVYELLLQLTRYFLIHMSDKQWEKDVVLLLRRTNVYERLYFEIAKATGDLRSQNQQRAEITSSLRSSANDVRQQLYCGLRMMILCVSELFRLEALMRRRMATALGDKKYYHLLHLFRSQLRDFNEYLANELLGPQEDGNKNEDGQRKKLSHTNAPSSITAAPPRVDLLMHITMFRWVPRALLNEWVLVSLEDFLKTRKTLNLWIEQTQTVSSSPAAVIMHTRIREYTMQLLHLFRLIMERVGDVDLQTVVLRALASGSASIVPLIKYQLAFIPSNVSSEESCWWGVERDILRLLDAFVTLDLYLPILNQWHQNNYTTISRKNSNSNSGFGTARTSITMATDLEVIEQRKAVLMASVLSPRLMETDHEDEEVSLWTYLLQLLLPNSEGVDGRAEDVPSTSAMLRIPQQFRCIDAPPVLLTFENQTYCDAFVAFLSLQQKLYVSFQPDEYSQWQVDFEACVASHIFHVDQYVSRLSASSSDIEEQRTQVCRVVELHLKCLIVLANHRTQFPIIQHAFQTYRVLPLIIKYLNSPRPVVPKQTQQVVESVQVKHSTVMKDYDGTAVIIKDDESSSIQVVKPLDLSVMPISVALLPKLHLHMSNLPLDGSVKDDQDQCFGQNLLVHDDDLHALTLLLSTSWIVQENTSELDPVCCPRYAIPTSACLNDLSNDDERSCGDLLWMLQQHLVIYPVDRCALNRMILDLESIQSFGVAARVSTICVLLRLLLPNSFDRSIYMKSEEVISTNKTAPIVNNEDNEDNKDDKEEEHDDTSGSRASDRHYIAKGAFATVYKTTPILSHPKALAVKVLDHQRRSGDLSVLSDLYNEISVLKRLQGELAAIQLLDFGNHDDASNFEIVTEYCPCTLAEWSASIHHHTASITTALPNDISRTNGDRAMSFRARLLLVLRAFYQICHCLMRLHAEGIAHFDIKSDNILIRTTPYDLTKRLLLHQEHYDADITDSKRNSSLHACFCFADFGESMIAASEFVEVPTRASTFTFTSTSAPPSPKATSSSLVDGMKKQSEKYFFLSRTRGTEAIKSPEMLKIKGSDPVHQQRTKITCASDVWSMGCLLYELITQELMFANDEWAALYAHLVVSNEKVLRSDHEEKLRAILQPTGEQEECIMTQLIDLYGQILVRHSSQRVSLPQLMHHVLQLIMQVLQLPMTEEEKMLMHNIASNTISEEDEPTKTEDGVENGVHTSSTLLSKPLHRSNSRNTSPTPRSGRQAGNTTGTAIMRLFWNMYLADSNTTEKICYSAQSGRTCSLASVMDEFEAENNRRFVHFVYFCWETNKRNDEVDQHACQNPSDKTLHIVSAIDEDDRRTMVFLNQQWRTDKISKFNLLHQLVMDAPHFFPMLQCKLHNETGNVVFLALDFDTATSNSHQKLTTLMTSTLLFFLQRSFALTPMTVLSRFTRDYIACFAYPDVEFFTQLSQLADQHRRMRRLLITKETERHVVICRCGFVVFAIASLAFRDGLATQQCICHSTTTSGGGSRAVNDSHYTCPCFHPFQALHVDRTTANNNEDDDLQSHFKDDAYPVDRTFIHDTHEEKLVLSMEARARGGVPVRWVYVDIAMVERLDSLLVVEGGLSQANAGGTHGSVAQSLLSPRSTPRKKKWHINKQNMMGGNVPTETSNAFTATPRASERAKVLVDGMIEQLLMTPGEQRLADRAWKLYACPLCRLPLCSLSKTRELLAVPIFSVRHLDN